MKEHLNIYVERLRDGDTEEISETIAPGFMECQEKDMAFDKPVTLSGEAYVTDDWLIVSLNIQTEAKLTCALCNQPFTFAVDIKRMMHEEPFENIKGKTYDLLPLIRESILLEIPFYPQCGITKCLHRDEVEPYLKNEELAEQEPQGNTPFKDLL